MAGVRIGGGAALVLPGTLPFSQIEGTVAPTDADQINVWIVTNGTGIRLTPYTDPTCVSPPCGDNPHTPKLNPAGTEVAFFDIDPDDFGMSLYVIPVDGSATYPLSPTFRFWDDAGQGFWGNYPFWHPDGDRIVFTTASPDGGSYMGGTIGGRIVEVTYPGGVATDLWTPQVQTPQREEGARPTYSPDGSFISWFVNVGPGGGGTLSRQGLWIMDADGSNITQLDNWASSSTNQGYLFSGPQQAWSSDSQWIAYVDRGFGGGGTWSVYKIHPDGTGKTKLADGSAGTIRHSVGYDAWINGDADVVATERSGPGIRAIISCPASGSLSTTTLVANTDGPEGTQNFEDCHVDTRSNRINWLPQKTPNVTIVRTCLLDGTDMQDTYTAADAVVAGGIGWAWD